MSTNTVVLINRSIFSLILFLVAPILETSLYTGAQKPPKFIDLSNIYSTLTTTLRPSNYTSTTTTTTTTALPSTTFLSPQPQLDDIMFQDDSSLHNQPSASKTRLSPERCQKQCQSCARSHDALDCKSGVNIIRDGCNCCQMCARQQGDLCDLIDLCDEVKGFYCDFEVDDGIRGYCRAKAARPCEVNGSTYKDGEMFHINATMQCTCQNGLYACSSLCPQELRAPSRTHCKDAQLVAINKRLCKEWVCPYSHSLPRPEDDFNNLPAGTSAVKESCPVETSGWSACSTTCGMGWSIRVTNRNKDCVSTQEKQLCLLRPCDSLDKYPQGQTCKSTWRQETHIRLEHDGCTSLEEYRPKYCSVCKKQRCCLPYAKKPRMVEFKCAGGKTIVENFMWIKSCRCSETNC